MWYDQPNTIAAFKGSLLFHPMGTLAAMPTREMAKKCKVFRQNVSLVLPEVEAFRFYLLNHLVGELKTFNGPYDDLGGKAQALRDYVREGELGAKRLFLYTLLIVTRESRHMATDHALYGELEQKYGTNFVLFHKNIRGKSSESVVELFEGDPPDMPLGQYVSAIHHIFQHGYFSDGYGGKPWANIADTLRKVVLGETTMEMFVDTAWTLAHNNGPMFNKGMMYQHYDQGLFTILDVQRAGMLPALFINLHKYKLGFLQMYLTPLESLIPLFPETFKGDVDWYMVESLGSLKPYPLFKKIQTVPSSDKPKLWVTDNEFVTLIEREAA